MKKRISSFVVGAVSIALSLAAVAAAAVPVIPGAAGFGIDTPAGRAGVVHRVTNLNASGQGSLKACVDAEGSRVCIFDVSGVIILTDDLTIRNPRITIAGQTAPSPGIMLRGAGLKIAASEVLVQHLRVRVGDARNGPDPVNRDALKIETSPGKPIRNIVVDHCSFSWAIDEMATAWLDWDNVSLLNNIFAEPLNDSLHPKGPHGYGVLFGPAPGKATMVGNLLAHQVERNALSRAGHFVFVNNVVYNRANMDVDLQNENGTLSRNAVVGNVFLRGPDYSRATPPVWPRDSGALSMLPGSQVFLSDNSAEEATSDPWSVAPGQGKKHKVSSAPTWPANLVARKTSGDAVLELVLRNAGARPIDRDAVDRRVVRNVRERGGAIVNCVSDDGSSRCQKNAGGWPQLPLNRRSLPLPKDPSRITSSGYTNLELWLHALAANIEGRPVAGSPGPATLSAN